MRDQEEIKQKIIELENNLRNYREIIKSAKGQNKDLANEPLFNQAQALRWVLDIGIETEDLRELNCGYIPPPIPKNASTIIFKEDFSTEGKKINKDD
jgi:hypothetical protein